MHMLRTSYVMENLQVESEDGCFYFATEVQSMTWFEAKDYCESMDAYLAEALNSETQNFLETHAKSLSPMNWWLGAIDQVSFY